MGGERAAPAAAAVQQAATVVTTEILPVYSCCCLRSWSWSGAAGRGGWLWLSEAPTSRLPPPSPRSKPSCRRFRETHQAPLLGLLPCCAGFCCHRRRWLLLPRRLPSHAGHRRSSLAGVPPRARGLLRRRRCHHTPGSCAVSMRTVWRRLLRRNSRHGEPALPACPTRTPPRALCPFLVG